MGLYGVKLLATVTMAILSTAAFTALAYVAIYFGRGDAGHEIIHRCPTAIGIHALSVVAYCCLFGLISLLTKWTLVSCVLAHGRDRIVAGRICRSAFA